MHLPARVLVATSVVLALLALCSAPARAQAVPPWLPGLSVKLLVRTLEFRDLVQEEIRQRLERRPLIFPRPAPPPILEPVLDPVLAPAPVRALVRRSLEPEFAP